MSNDRLEKEMLEDGIKIYSKIAKTNFNFAIQKNLWLTEQLNRSAEQFTERLFWFAGISIGILPFILENTLPKNDIQSGILITSISLLVISMLIGIIDHYIIESFYKRNNQKEKDRVQNWQPIITIVQNKYRNPMEIVNSVEEGIAFDNKLELNKETRSAEWPGIVQTITVILGFLLELLYLLIVIL